MDPLQCLLLLATGTESFRERNLPWNETQGHVNRVIEQSQLVFNRDTCGIESCLRLSLNFSAWVIGSAY